MDLTSFPNVPQAPLPTEVVSKGEFKKSKFIIVLACIQLLGLVSFFFKFSYISPSDLLSIIIYTPALIVIFTKNKLIYLIAKWFLIIECIFLLILLAVFLFIIQFISWH